jgi:hypothetical protein
LFELPTDCQYYSLNHVAYSLNHVARSTVTTKQDYQVGQMQGGITKSDQLPARGFTTVFVDKVNRQTVLQVNVEGSMEALVDVLRAHSVCDTIAAWM